MLTFQNTFSPVIFRFSLPDGALTTYDSYPERTLPDGRVSVHLVLTVPILNLLAASRLVVRHSCRMAERHLSEPRPPHAENGSSPPSHAAWHRQLCCGGRNMAQHPHGFSSGKKSGSRTTQGPDKYRSQKPTPTETNGQIVDRITATDLGGYELSRCADS